MSDDPGVDYRAAKESVTHYRQAQHDAEVARNEWLHAHRGVSADLLWSDPELVALDAAVSKALADTVWCQCVVVACGEVVKGKRFVMPGPSPRVPVRA